MTPELIKQWALKAGYDLERGERVSEASDGELFRSFAALVAAHQRELDAKVCEAEHLEDPQDHADDAYDQACFDCAAAIRGTK